MRFQVESPFPTCRLPKLWDWIQEFKTQMVDDLSPDSLEALITRHGQELEAGAKQYYYTLSGEPAGVVWGVNAGDGMYVGHLVFEREGLTTTDKIEMAKDALRRMFEAGARKIIWPIFADNRAFRIFLKKLGAEQEGYLKQVARRNGELVDVIMMASFGVKA